MVLPSGFGENTAGRLLGFQTEDIVFLVVALVFGLQPLIILICDMAIQANFHTLWMANFRYRLAYYTLYMLAGELESLLISIVLKLVLVAY